MFLKVVILLVGFLFLVKGADWFVEGAASIAKKLGIPQLIIGLTIVAMGTSMPEAAVSITAALQKNAGITIGNIVGSNILNILIILGVTAVITNVAIQTSTFRYEIPFMMVVTIILLVFGITGGEVTFVEGIIFWVLFLLYLGYLFVMAKKGTNEEEGYEAYVVGGCVRDSILGRSPDDWDITTSAKPEQVKALFHRTVDTGLQHGTVTVLMEKEGYEVTTYRVDGEYEDGRHPKEVTFTASLKEDLKRRDFTINAMAYNPSSGLVDLFGGLEDIERKIIRCVGDPLERFTEDALRIMRAVRFSAQLGFAIEEETRKALKVLAPNLKHVSAERIQVELVKLLMSPHPDYLRVAYEAGITAEFLPEFDACMTTSQNTPHHCYTVGEHILHSLCHVRADKVLRITMLLHDIGKPVVRKTDENGRDHFKMHGIAGEKMAAQILRRLKFDNDTIRKVTRLVKWHDDRPEGMTKAVRRAVNRIGEDLFPYYLEVQQADMLAQSDYRRTEKQERLDKVKEAYETIINEHQCVSLKTLAVTGKDLIEAGYKPGREIGETLNRLLEVVLVDPQKNQKEILLGLLDEK